MTRQQIEAVVARQLVAEARYLEAVFSFPAIRAERRRILEETERELGEAVAAGACTEASGRPADASGNPDCGIIDFESEAP